MARISQLPATTLRAPEKNPPLLQRPTILRGHTATVTAAAWSPSKRPIVSGDRDTKTLRFWDPGTGALLQTRQQFVHAVEDLAFSPNGKVLASAGDKTVRLWNPNVEARPTILRGPAATVTSLSFNHDGMLIASGSADGSVWVWDATTGARVDILAPRRVHRGLELPGVPIQVAFNPSGDAIAIGSADGSLRLWTIPDVAGAPALSQRKPTPTEWMETPAPAPEETGLLANYPNPFNPETWIPYQLATPAEVAVSIYAANGQLIRTLAMGHQPAGRHVSVSESCGILGWEKQAR